MRKLLVLILGLALVATACSGDGPDVAEDGENGEPIGTDTEVATPRPRPGDIELAIDPMTLDDLPATPQPGSGIVVVDGEELTFAVEFCSPDRPIGTGEGDGYRVAWDLRDDGDHRVSVRWTDDEDRRLVRGGPASADWDVTVVRFAGAFIPFRADDGADAVPGGLIVSCPEGGA